MHSILRRAGLSALTGILAGLAAAVFLYLLEWATQTRDAHTVIIYALPLAGLLIGWAYHGYGKEAVPGNSLIIDAIHDPKKTVPLRMAPLILFSTVLTHLFGGSAGREGTAVQMGGSLADQVARRFGREGHERRALLMAGAAAGFAAAIGAPWAGAIFGMEMLYVRRLRFAGWFECLIAAFVGYGTTLLVHAPHSVFPSITVPEMDLNGILFVALAGMAFGLAARVFVYFTHAVEWLQARTVRIPMWKPFAGAILLLVMFKIEGSYRFAGLGIPVISQALESPSSFYDSFMKTIFTAVTLGSGFKGGEFIPLVFIGATLGSALSMVLPVSFQLLAAVGFAASFGAAANTPLACAVMAMEIFGWSIAPYALVGCYMAFIVSGPLGIYKSQR
ncbi:MAG: chloride channel protein [Bdellovibrionales bacterium]|nr:chloride channel protein [Bdellovibrionales bacterium]